MGIVKEVKKKMVRELTERYRNYRNFVLIDYRKLPGSQATTLRKSLRQDGVRVSVVKNAVARLALDGLGMKELAKAVEGMNAVVYGEDAVVIAKKIVEFSQKAKVLSIRGGVVDGKAMSKADIEQLSKLPSKKEMQAQFLGTMIAPLTQWLGTVNAILTEFLLTLKALEEKKATG